MHGSSRIVFVFAHILELNMLNVLVNVTLLLLLFQLSHQIVELHDGIVLHFSDAHFASVMCTFLFGLLEKNVIAMECLWTDSFTRYNLIYNQNQNVGTVFTNGVRLGFPIALEMHFELIVLRKIQQNTQPTNRT